jgi:hypothetical protein
MVGLKHVTQGEADTLRLEARPKFWSLADLGADSLRRPPPMLLEWTEMLKRGEVLQLHPALSTTSASAPRPAPPQAGPSGASQLTM